MNRLLALTLLLTTAIPHVNAAPDTAQSVLAGKSWVEKCVEQYPEILWLADENVRKTEEGQASRTSSYSEQLFNRQYIEFDRTLMTLHVLRLILDGGDAAYQTFTADQPADVRLSRESFSRVHHQGQSLVKSGWGEMSEPQIIQTMETALILGDMGKSKRARDLFGPFDAHAPDHDDFYEEMIRLLPENPRLSPSFYRLPPQAKELLAKIANLAHYGHITHLEGGPSMFDKLRSNFRDSFSLSFDLFIHACDVAGALGHANPRSSLMFTELTSRAVTATGAAVHVLADPDKTAEDAYRAYVSRRASWLGLNPENRLERVLTRVGAMLRLFTLEEGEVLRQAINELAETEREKVISALEIQKNDPMVRTPTYMPAVLVNLFNNPRLGESKAERLKQVVIIGLPLLSKILDQHRKALIHEQADPYIPLNFNRIAGVAKTNPKFFQRPFWIDKEGNALLIEAIIFDCDGVLVDTEYLKFLAWQDALASKNISFILEEYMPLVGHSSENILQRIQLLKGVEIDNQVLELRNSKYGQLQKQGVPPIHPMVDYARRLSEERNGLELKLGLASSAPQEEIMNNLKQIGLENAFDLIISGSDDLKSYVDAEGKNKPKPYIYMEAAKRLNVAPSACIVLEDTSAGVEAAYGAGMMALAVPNRFTANQDFSKAKATLESTENLPFSIH